MTWTALQRAFGYDPKGGDQDLQALVPCKNSEILYYLRVHRKPFTLNLVRPGEVDDPGIDRTVDLGTYRTWRGVEEALQTDLAMNGC